MMFLSLNGTIPVSILKHFLAENCTLVRPSCLLTSKLTDRQANIHIGLSHPHGFGCAKSNCCLLKEVFTF